MQPGVVPQQRELDDDELALCERPVTDLFRAQARRTPDAVAVDGEGQPLTFAELDRASDAIAAAIHDELGPEHEAVGVALDSMRDIAAAFVGVLKAGKALAPLHTRNAPAPPGDLLSACGARLLIADAPGDGLPAGIARRTPAALETAGRGRSAIEPARSPAQAALVMHTSGSTGTPKAMGRPRRALVHSLLLARELLGIGPGARAGILLSPAFGTPVNTIFAALAFGGTLARYDAAGRGVQGAPEWLERHDVHSTTIVPSMIEPLAGAAGPRGLPTLRCLNLVAERLTRAAARTAQGLLGPEARLIQGYGATEAARICTAVFTDPIAPGDAPLPVGLAIPGVHVEVRTADGGPAPVGTPGEVFVTSRFLGGRWGEEVTGVQTIATGDAGVIGDDGQLSLHGRRDRMVKVRGHRIQVEAVERAVAAVPGVLAAAVIDEAGPHGTRRLAAYLVPAGPNGDVAADARRQLRSALPAYMVPARFVALDALPRLGTGKPDLRALARLGAPARDGAGDDSRGELEEVLSQLWCEALDVDAVGRDDDFFDLGGDSLSAAVIATGVHELAGVELEMTSFADAPTIAAMAALVERRRADGDSPDEPDLVRVPRSGPLPLSFAQERTWRYTRTPEASDAYLMARATDIRGPLDVDALRRCIDFVFRRHEVLRTTFAERDGAPVQVVHPAAPVELGVVDLSGVRDPAAAADELLDREAARPCDLERGPLVRIVLARLGERHHRLLRVSHHIVSDAASWQLFFDEVAVLYEPLRRGEPPPLPPDLEIQFADFAVWERRRLDPEAPRAREQLDAWRRALERPAPRLALPFERAAGPVAGLPPDDGIRYFGLDPEVSAELDRVGRASAVTHFMSRLALFAACLGLDTGQSELVLGSYVSNRRRAELRDMFGYFVNLTTLRLAFDPELSLEQWIRRVRAQVLDTAARAEVPYEHVAAHLTERGIALPEIRAVFAVGATPAPRRIGELDLTSVLPRYPAMPWGFTFTSDRGREHDRCQAAFDAAVHDPAEVAAFVERYRRLAAAAAAAPDRPLDALSRR
ncbi:MAG: hypothetical protein QOE65_1875 [Solirubrobacteraceae bacterium]|nr:hypothetical protein [Solirubrobacteraceae bacterium]